MATKQGKALLIEQGAKLTTLGIQVEAARSKLKRLVEVKKLPVTDPRVREALAEFKKLDNEWKLLEQVHLVTRRQLETERE